MSKLVLCLAVFMLAGCATVPSPSEARAVIDTRLTNPCPPLLPLTDGESGTVLRWIAEFAEQYRQCARQLDALVEAIK